MESVTCQSCPAPLAKLLWMQLPLLSHIPWDTTFLLLRPPPHNVRGEPRGTLETQEQCSRVWHGRHVGGIKKAGSVRRGAVCWWEPNSVPGTSSVFGNFKQFHISKSAWFGFRKNWVQISALLVLTLWSWEFPQLHKGNSNKCNVNVDWTLPM